MPSGNPQEQEQPERELPQSEVDAIFANHESKSNLVGLYSLLLKIDRRQNPQLYD
jgi:hypothetical protein